MPTNLLRFDGEGFEVNNDPECAPLTLARAMITLQNAKNMAVNHAGRLSAVVPRMRVEVYKHCLAYQASSVDAITPISARIAIDQSDGATDLTPFVTAVSTSKSIHASALGSCEITLKGDYYGKVAPRGQSHMEGNKAEVNWVDELEDNDIIIVHLDAGLASTNESKTAGSGMAPDVQYLEFTEKQSATGLLGDDDARYSVLHVGRRKAPVVFFGYIDSIQRTRSTNGLGGESVTYRISASDFSKAMSSYAKPVGLETTTQLDTAFSNLANAQKDISQAPTPEVFSSFLLYELLGGRAIDDDVIAELTKVAKSLDNSAPSNQGTVETTSASVASSSGASKRDETSIQEQLNHLLSTLSTGFSEKALGKIRPSRFLLPKELTKKGGPFDNERISQTSADVETFHLLGGVQLVELLHIVAGYASTDGTRKGEEFLAGGDDQTITLDAKMAGLYGGFPSEVRLVLGADGIQSIFTTLKYDFETIESVISSTLNTIPTMLDYFYDIKDFFGVTEDTYPLCVPSLVCNSSPRPLQLISERERESYRNALKDVAGRSNDSLLIDRYAQAGISFMNTPINFIADTDVVAETIEKSGATRSTFSGISQHSINDSSASAMSVYNTTSNQPDVGRRVDNPLYHVTQQEQAHGFLPNYTTSSDVQDSSIFGEGGSFVNFSNTAFVKNRDQQMVSPLELRGTITSSLLLPSARVGERVAVFRGSRAVPTLADFTKLYDANRIEQGINLRFADDFSSFISEIPDVVSHIRGELEPREFDGAQRAWFFAHFDCYVIDDVSHSIDVQAQDGGIEASTTLTVSYGALGREYPKIQASEILPTTRDPQLQHKFMNSVLRVIKENNLSKLSGASKMNTVDKSPSVIASDLAREQFKARIKQRIDGLQGVGLQINGIDEVAVWRAVGSQSKVQQYSEAHNTAKAYARHFTMNLDDGTVVRTPQLVKDLSFVETLKGVGRFPQEFEGELYLQTSSILLYLADQPTSIEITISVNGNEATVFKSDGNVNFMLPPIAQAITNSVVEVEAYLLDLAVSAKQTRDSLHRAFPTKSP